jgi:hypothetical protein
MLRSSYLNSTTSPLVVHHTYCAPSPLLQLELTISYLIALPPTLISLVEGHDFFDSLGLSNVQVARRATTEH